VFREGSRERQEAAGRFPEPPRREAIHGALHRAPFFLLFSLTVLVACRSIDLAPPAKPGGVPGFETCFRVSAVQFSN